MQVIVIDELSHHLTEASRPTTELLRDILERGPMVGFVVVAASHQPSMATVPPVLRELFGLRWALRCQTGEAAETIVGPRWRRRGYDPSRSAAASPVSATCC